MRPDPRISDPKVKVATRTQTSPAPIVVLVGLLSLVVLLINGAMSGI